MKIRRRFFGVLLIFFKIFLDFNKERKLARKIGFQAASKKMEKTHSKRSLELYTLSVELGGVLIKMCQYLSTRRDIFPEPYIETLAKLQDNVPPVDYKDLKKVIDNEYKNIEFPFTYVDERPLASASLGQTHKALLKNGKEVVIKVLKPDIEEKIDTDFAILFSVFKLFSKLKAFKDFADFGNVLDEFIKVTGDELNFKREIYISKKFKEGMKKFDFIKVPYVYEEFSTDKIIVMELIKGDKINEIDKWKNRNNDPITISRRLIEIYIEQFLTLKLIHFDPHPGNIFIMDNNNIALIDYGMSGEITDKMRDGIKNGIRGFVKKDYLSILKILKELGFFKKDADINKLLPIVRYFLDEVLETVDLEKESMQNIDISPVIDDLVEIIYTQPFKLPYEWAYIGRTLGTLTGIISFLNPKFKIYDELEPYFNRVLNENIGDIVNTAIDESKAFIQNIIGLPDKVNTFVNRVETGNLKFEVDFEDIDNRVNNISNTVVRLFCFFISFISFSFGFVMNLQSNFFGMIIFGSISFIFLMIFIFYKRISKRELIKQTIKQHANL